MINTLTAKFKEAINTHGGTMVEESRTGIKEFSCATFQIESEIQPGDKILGGIMLNQVGEEPSLHGFTFRLVCSNGSMMPEFSKKEVSVSEEGLVEAVETILFSLKQESLNPITQKFKKALKRKLTPERLNATVLSVSFLLLRKTNKNRFFAERRTRRYARRRLLVLMDHERNRNFPNQTTRSENTLFDLSNAVTDFAHEVEDTETKAKLMRLGAEILELENPVLIKKPSQIEEIKTKRSQQKRSKRLRQLEWLARVQKKNVDMDIDVEKLKGEVMTMN